MTTEQQTSPTARRTAFLIIAIILIGFLVYQFYHFFTVIEPNAKKAVDESELQLKLANERVAETQARLNYHLNN